MINRFIRWCCRWGLHWHAEAIATGERVTIHCPDCNKTIFDDTHEEWFKQYCQENLFDHDY